MVYLIGVILVLSLWHFVYEGILAPSYRLHLRNELFSLRDELRKLKIEGHVTEADAKVFEFVHAGINAFLGRLPELTFSAQQHARHELQNNENWREKVEKRLELINACQNEEVRSIFERACSTAAKAFLINSGGWIVYVVPAVMCLLFYKSFKHLVSELVAAPPAIADRLLPRSDLPLKSFAS